MILYFKICCLIVISVRCSFRELEFNNKKLQVKLMTIVEGYPKVPLSIATVGEDVTPALDCSTLLLIRTL